MTFFLFRRVAIGNRNSGIKQTFGPKLWKAEERAPKPFLYKPTAPPRHQIQIDIRSSGKKN